MKKLHLILALFFLQNVGYAQVKIWAATDYAKAITDSVMKSAPGISAAGKLITDNFFSGHVRMWNEESNEQTYKNPIIPGFYSDPSICRVDSNYYLVNSSFEYFPGIPIWQSKDLIHWQQIGNVLDRYSQLDLKGAKYSDAIGAATIRYHKGIFYVTYCKSLNGMHNQYVYATNPAGPWSQPIEVNQNGIDPSIFFDDGDGKVYFQTNRSYTFNTERAIYQSEIDITTGKRLTDIKQLWKGGGGSYVEGPHIYKINNYFYLLTAEGGTGYGHSVAIARSKNIWGPYEACPHNPILTNRMSYSNIQGAGHGDLVQDHHGNWWMVHLAFRPAVDGIHFIGRETCLLPLKWNKNGWPVVNKTGMSDEKITTPQLLPSFAFKPLDNYGCTNFKTRLGYEWIYLRNPDSANYSIDYSKGLLSLQGSPITLNEAASPTFLGIRQRHFDCTVSAQLQFNPSNQNEEAGLVIYMNPFFHYDFYIKETNGKKYLQLRYKLDSLEQVKQSIEIPDEPINLMVKCTKKNYGFYYEKNGTEHFVGNLNTRFLGTEVAGGFTGVVMGMYASGNGFKSNSIAHFSNFNYNNTKN